MSLQYIKLDQSVLDRYYGYHISPTNVAVSYQEFPKFESKAGDLVSKCRLYTHLEKYCREGSVGIATRYGLDGLGIESQWERSFPHPSRTAMGPNHPPAQWVAGLYRG